MEEAALLDLFGQVAATIRERLDRLADWGRADGHEGQYQHDVVADLVAVPMLLDAGLGVISEESGVHAADRAIVAVIDPIDGSTNASIGLPWFATSACAVDADGPLASLVVNQATGTTYTAVRGGGAWRDGVAIAPSTCSELGDAIVVLNDLPARHFGWRQYRVMGAAALDICCVADGTFDGFADCGLGLAPWDHLGAQLVCSEAGATVAAVGGADLHAIDLDARVNLVAGATPALTSALAAVAR